MLVSFLPVVLSGIIVTAVLSVAIFFKQEHQNLEIQLQKGMQSVELEMQSHADVMLHSTQTVLDQEEVKSPIEYNDRQELLEILLRLQRVLEADAVEILNRDGIVLAEAHRLSRYGQNDSHKGMFRDALSGRPQAGVGPSDLGLAIEVFFPVEEQGEITGVVEVAQLLGQKFLQRIKNRYGLESMIYDGGRLQATSFTDPQIILDTELALFIETAESQRTVMTGELKLGVTSYYLSSKPILSSERKVVGSLILAVSHEHIHQTLWLIIASFGGFVLIMVIVTVVMCYRISSGLVHPINRLASVTKEISQGDLTRKVEVSSVEEIRQLGMAFNAMTDKLRKSTTSIENLNKEIAERKQTEEALKSANRELDAFVYTVSHDLRTPLTCIIGYADFLLDSCRGRVNNEVFECLTAISVSGDTMMALMKDLLTLARVGQLERPAEPLDTMQIAEETITSLSEMTSKAGVSIKVGHLPDIQVPKSLLLQVFYNLIGNAVRYGCKAGDVVEVGGERLGERVRLYVRDQGPGIPAEERNRIFEAFFRGKTGKTQQGTGIGLATVMKIARMYEGLAWAEETSGGGSTFWVEMVDSPAPEADQVQEE